MNFSAFKNKSKESHLTGKELQSVVGVDSGLTTLIGASTGWNLSLVTVNNQQTATNPLGAAAMLSDSQMTFSGSGISPNLIVHESVNVSQYKGTNP